MTKSNFEKMAKLPLFARPPRAARMAQARSRAMARCAPPTAARREGPAARCNLRQSSRPNSSAG